MKASLIDSASFNMDALALYCEKYDVGTEDGKYDGASDGYAVITPAPVGWLEIGRVDGALDTNFVGSLDGKAVGRLDGNDVGTRVGRLVGALAGRALGRRDGRSGYGYV
jgi:hypothetical protein